MAEAIKVDHPLVKHLSELDLIKFQLGYILESYDFNNTELTLLSYVFLYGGKATENISRSGILNKKTAENYISSNFRKIGLVHGTGAKLGLHPDIKPILSDIDFTIKLRLINEVKENVEVPSE